MINWPGISQDYKKWHTYKRENELVEKKRILVIKLKRWEKRSSSPISMPLKNYSTQFKQDEMSIKDHLNLFIKNVLFYSLRITQNMPSHFFDLYTLFFKALFKIKNSNHV